MFISLDFLVFSRFLHIYQKKDKKPIFIGFYSCKERFYNRFKVDANQNFLF